MEQWPIERIRNEIVDLLSRKCPDLPDTSWAPLTALLTNRLRALGTEAGFTVWDRATTGEYLYDIAWTFEPEGATQQWLELAGEIEVSDPDLPSILDDFHKVLDAKARLKLFVCASAQSTANQLREKIDRAVSHQRFVLAEERLVAILVAYDGRTRHYVATIGIFEGLRRRGDWERRILTTAPI